MIDKVATPAFTLHLNGSDAQGMERFGEPAGMILQDNIPAFLVEVGKAVAAAGESYGDWKKAHGEQLQEIVERYLVK